MADALFTINGDSSNQGFDANPSQVLTLRLKTLPVSGVNSVRFQVWDASSFDPDVDDPIVNPPRKSKGSPDLTLVGATSGSSVSPATVDGTVTVTMPATRFHAYIVRCVVNGGLSTLPDGREEYDPQLIHERLVVIRTTLGRRPIVATETTQYEDDGWAPEISASGGAVTSVFGRTGAVVATTDDYTDAQITNTSSVSGTAVRGALNTLLAAILALGSSSIANQSGVSGANVSNSLDVLNGAIQSIIAGSGVIVVDSVATSTPGAGTWTKSSSAFHLVRVRAWGAGGGGGGGIGNAAGSQGGGSAGGGGAFDERIFLPGDLGATESYSVGQGGSGGTGTNTGSAGTSGTAGTLTSFGTVPLVVAFGGGGGTSGTSGGGGGGGQISAGQNAVASAFGGYPRSEDQNDANQGFGGASANATTGQPGRSAAYGGGSGGGAGNGGTVSGAGGVSMYGGGGGGAGGGVTNTGVVNSAGAGGASGRSTGGTTSGGGGTAGNNSGGAGGNGADGNDSRPHGGSGGGGGGGNSGTGGNGGNGGSHGGGGGGGGASNAGTGGNGGNGGNGRFVAVSIRLF